jgi:hypothetical protein
MVVSPVGGKWVGHIQGAVTKLSIPDAYVTKRVLLGVENYRKL